MKKRFLLLLLITALSGCLVSCIRTNVVSDDFLRLELIVSDTEYIVDEPIECKAILTYVGKGESFTFYPRDPIVKIVIDGGEYFHAGNDLVYKDIIMPAVTIYKDQPMEFLLEKYMGTHIGTDEEAVAFWEDFLAEEQFLLENGVYEIIACCPYSTEQLGEETTLMAREKIVVR